jgi:phytoene dehydrogenase-like protein
MTYDAIIIGAGHNGLVAAAKLGKAGKKVLVLERRGIVGGAAITEELHPGFKCSTLSYTPGVFQSSITNELQLKKHGFEMIDYDPAVVAPAPDGSVLQFWNDRSRTVESIAKLSSKDAKTFPEFEDRMTRLISYMHPLWTKSLPDPATAGAGDIMELLGIAWKLKGIKEKEALQMMRILPMSIADLLNENFENPLLKGVLASEGIMGSFYGPRSAGSVYVLFYLRMGRGDESKFAWPLARGGMGSLTEAISKAAKSYGVEIRINAEVSKILVKDGIVQGVVLSNGDEIRSKFVASNADAKRTFLKLVDPVHFEPGFLQQVSHIKMRGVSAKVNFALDDYPKWKNVDSSLKPVSVLIAPDLDYLERAFDDAKYGRYSRSPFLEIAIPTAVDSSLAPSGKHVMSVYVLFAPYHLKEGNWKEKREEFGDNVVKTIEQYAPGFSNTILKRQVITPLDLETEFGMTEGHIHHGEISLDQIMFMRPVPGYSRYRTPIEGLYLCGAAAHPGGGVTGIPGALAAEQMLSDLR